jgi:endonuclease YncB( thermonuclease family)
MGSAKMSCRALLNGWARALLVVSLCASNAAIDQSEARTLACRVVGIVDGDTVVVLDDQRVQRKVRLAGIDAPERGQPFGTRAKQKLSALVGGQTVTVDWHKEDRYGRIVGKLIVDGQDANLVDYGDSLLDSLSAIRGEISKLSPELGLGVDCFVGFSSRARGRAFIIGGRT